MTKMLGQLTILTRRARLLGLAAVWMLAVAWVAPAAAQEGPGVRAGLSASPDQFFIGGHYVTRPLVDRLRFQPNVEAGFGSDATLVAFNVEFGFWMRLNAEWQAFVGGGPAMNLYSSDHQDTTDIKAGFNVLAGVQRRGGLFFELKVGVIDSPDVKLTVGYTIR
jgi:hypothetical protein